MDLNQQVAIANAVMRIVCGDSRSYIDVRLFGCIVPTKKRMPIAWILRYALP